MSTPEVEAHKSKHVPVNTERSAAWSLKLLTNGLWQEKPLEKTQAEEFLLCDNKETKSHWLCQFFLEVRKVDGTCYTPRSLLSVLAGINRYIQEKSQYEMNIQNQENFKSFIFFSIIYLKSYTVKVSVQRSTGSCYHSR